MRDCGSVKNQRIIGTTSDSVGVSSIEQRRTALNPNPAISATMKRFRVRDYDLAATLTSGQTFRWRIRDDSWLGIIGEHSVRLRADKGSILAETAEPVMDWNWLTDYLQTNLDLEEIVKSFPDDK